jgi:hypothetical protein
MTRLINATPEQSFPPRNSIEKLGLLCVVVAEGSLVGLAQNPTFQAVTSKITTTKIKAVGQIQLPGHKLITQARNWVRRPEIK